jgi:hypothetical protein
VSEHLLQFTIDDACWFAQGISGLTAGPLIKGDLAAIGNGDLSILGRRDHGHLLRYCVAGDRPWKVRDISEIVWGQSMVGQPMAAAKTGDFAR